MRNKYVVIVEDQFCYGDSVDCAPQGQIFEFEEAIALAKKLNDKEPNYTYKVHRIIVGPEIKELGEGKRDEKDSSKNS